MSRHCSGFCTRFFPCHRGECVRWSHVASFASCVHCLVMVKFSDGKRYCLERNSYRPFSVSCVFRFTRRCKLWILSVLFYWRHSSSTRERTVRKVADCGWLSMIWFFDMSSCCFSRCVGLVPALGLPTFVVFMYWIEHLLPTASEAYENISFQVY